MRPALIAEGAERVVTLTEKQRMLAFALKEVNTMSGGRGVILNELELREQLLAITVVGAIGVVVEGAGRGGKEFNLTLTGRELAAYTGKRARKGKLLLAKIKAAGLRPA